MTVNGGATFDVSGSTCNGSIEIRTLAGGGTVQLGGNGLVIDNGSTEFSGTIADGGIAGTLVKSMAARRPCPGMNTYTGLTQIDRRRHLALKGDGSIATSAVVTFSPGGPGQVGTFDISQANTGAPSPACSMPPRPASSAWASKTLTITDTTGGLSFDGVIQDGGIGGGTGGSLVLAANAVHDLAGVNTYTGSTTIMGGATLSLLEQGQHRRVERREPRRRRRHLRYFGLAAPSQTIKDLAGVAGSTVALGGTALTVGTANSTTFGGVIADGGSSGGSGGSLVKQRHRHADAHAARTPIPAARRSMPA